VPPQNEVAEAAAWLPGRLGPFPAKGYALARLIRELLKMSTGTLSPAIIAKQTAAQALMDEAFTIAEELRLELSGGLKGKLMGAVVTDLANAMTKISDVRRR
jgi:hypothetical protein